MCATLVQAVCGLFRLLSQALAHSLHYRTEQVLSVDDPGSFSSVTSVVKS